MFPEVSGSSLPFKRFRKFPVQRFRFKGFRKFPGVLKGTQGVLEAGPLAAAQDAALQALTAEVAQLHSQVRTQVLKGYARGTQGVRKGYSSHVCPLRHIHACTYRYIYIYVCVYLYIYRTLPRSSRSQQAAPRAKCPLGTPGRPRVLASSFRPRAA